MKISSLKARATQELVKTDLPRYVHKKVAKGRPYFYFETGKRTAAGRPIRTRIPAPGTAGYTVQLKKAQLARWRHFSRVIPPMQLGSPPADDFDAATLRGEPPEDGDDLYFIRAGDAVKIGRATDVYQRMTNMQTNTHLELDCVCRLPLRGHEERHWQALFRDNWIRGEWFDWTPEIAAAIDLARKGQDWWLGAPNDTGV